MKRHITFILIYSFAFPLISIMCTGLADGSNEMLSSALWGSVLYIPVSILGWFFINPAAGFLKNSIARLIIRFLMGSIILFGFIYFAGGGGGKFLILLGVFCVYTISFLIASVAYNQSSSDNVEQIDEAA